MKFKKATAVGVGRFLVLGFRNGWIYPNSHTRMLLLFKLSSSVIEPINFEVCIANLCVSVIYYNNHCSRGA